MFEVESRILKSIDLYPIGNDYNYSLFYKDLLIISCYKKVSILFQSLNSSVTFGISDKDYSFNICLLSNRKQLVVVNGNEIIFLQLYQNKFIISKKFDLGFSKYVKLFIEEEGKAIIAICVSEIKKAWDTNYMEDNLIVYSLDEEIKIETFLKIKANNLFYLSKCRTLLGFCNNDSLNFIYLKH